MRDAVAPLYFFAGVDPFKVVHNGPKNVLSAATK